MEQKRKNTICQRLYTFREFVDIMREIREKCPWDSVQTHESLRTCLKNETEEVMEGISLLNRTGDGENLCEELGDLLMQVVLHSLIAEEEGLFTIDDVISYSASKMQFRHPGIFCPEDKEAVSMTWDELKKKEHILRGKWVNNGRNPQKEQKNLDNTR